MSNIPQLVRSIFQEWSFEFSHTVWPRFQFLVLSSILCIGRHTICGLMRVAGFLSDGHWSSYHRVLSLRHWSIWRLARILATFVVDRFVPAGIISLVGDDTVTEHPGKHVYGKGCHRDATRSSHSYVAWRWGHKWVVLGIQVKLPGLNRPWVLPILCALYRSAKEDARSGRHHKTCVDLIRQLICVLMLWFPQRKFRFAGDGNYATHPLGRFAMRHPRLTLVSKFYPDAMLYTPPPKRKAGQKGRPRVKGRKLPTPQAVVERTKHRTVLHVSWYGGKGRRVETVTGTGHWYKSGYGLVALRWVYVKDLTGTHRDEYFFTTDLEMTPREIIEAYTGRWSIEVTFEEVREHLGMETTRGWSQQTVLRAEPCLFGLYTLVAIWFSELPESERQTPVVPWTGTTKKTLTFSDAITLVRRHIWRNWIFASPRYSSAFQKLTNSEKTLLINTITQAT